MKVSKKEQKARKLKAHRKAQQDYIALKENKLYCYNIQENYHTDLIYTLLLSTLMLNLKEWNEQASQGDIDIEENLIMDNKLQQGKYIGQVSQMLNALGVIPLDTFYILKNTCPNMHFIKGETHLPFEKYLKDKPIVLGTDKCVQASLNKNKIISKANNKIQEVIEAQYFEGSLEENSEDSEDSVSEDSVEDNDTKETKSQTILKAMVDRICLLYEYIEKINTFYTDSILSDLKVMPSLVKKEISRIVEETHSKYKYEMKHTIGSKYNDSTLNEVVREELNNNQYFLMLEEVYRFIARLNIFVSHINIEYIKSKLNRIINDDTLTYKEKRTLITTYLDTFTILENSEKNESAEDYGLVEYIYIQNHKTTEDEDLSPLPIQYYKVKPIWQEKELISNMDYLNKLSISRMGRVIDTRCNDNFSSPMVSKLFKLKFQNSKGKLKKIYITENDSRFGMEIKQIYNKAMDKTQALYGYELLIRTGKYYTYLLYNMRTLLQNNKTLIDNIKSAYHLSSDYKVKDLFCENQYDISVLTQEDIDNNKSLFISDTKELDKLSMEYINHNLERHYSRADRNFIDTSINKLNELMNYVSTENLDSKDTEDIDKKLLVNQTSGWFSSPCLPPELIINLYEQQLTYLNFNEVLKDLKPTKKTTEIKLKRTRMLKAQKEKYIYTQKQIWDNGKKFTEGNGLIKWYREIKLWELSLNPLDREVQLNKKYTKERCERILGHLKKICESICITSFQ